MWFYYKLGGTLLIEMCGLFEKQKCHPY